MSEPGRVFSSADHLFTGMDDGGSVTVYLPGGAEVLRLTPRAAEDLASDLERTAANVRACFAAKPTVNAPASTPSSNDAPERTI